MPAATRTGAAMDTDVIWGFLGTQGVDFGLKVLGAIAVWVVGRWVIGWIRKLALAALKRGKKIDATLAGYLSAALSMGLNIMLVLAVLEVFGVKTTSFAAL